MKHIFTSLLLSVITLPCITFSQVPSESVHMNSRRITWNSTQTNGSFDVQWARSVKGPWHDTWDAMLGIPATNGVMTVDAPHFFRVVHRPLPGYAVGSYIGYRWNCCRTKWDIGNEWVSSVPEPRDGFNYGIDGDGRSAIISTHVDDPEWTDYSVEFDLELTGVDASFNPHSLPLDFRQGKFIFRVEAMPESWFEGRTMYALTLLDHNGQIQWTLGRYNEYGTYAGGSAEVLLTGDCSADITSVNRIKVSCIGNVISAWINDEFLGTYTDTSPLALSQGGIGFLLHSEAMGRFRDMEIIHHTDE